MAWYIPQDKMNNNPFSQNEAEKRFEQHGLLLLDKYINNRTRHHCIDNDGYKVMATLDSLGKVKEYARFSPSSNPDGFIYNANKWVKENNVDLVIKDWFYPDITKRNLLMVNCVCGECNENFVTRWNQIKTHKCIRCKKCVAKISNIAKSVENYLQSQNIEYLKEYKFYDCKDKRPLPFDFYLIKYNCCIEVDGEQHYFEHSQTKWKNGKNIGEQFEKIKLHDKIKTDYCEAHDIKLIRLKYNCIRNNKFKDIINELLQG